MDSEDEGGFLQANYSRPSHSSLCQPPFQHHIVTASHQPYSQVPSIAGTYDRHAAADYGHLYGRQGGLEEPLYARVAPKSNWGQRRGFSEPATNAPRPWHHQPIINNGASYQPNLVAAGRLPAVQQIYGTNELSSLPVEQPGHFGVDTEMIEERWLHMQEARRRQQLTSDHIGPGGAPAGMAVGGGIPADTAGLTATSKHLHSQQLAATYSPESARQIYIQRKDGGFGFTLRHFIVYPPEEGDTNGPPISEPMDTIFVKFIKEGGPATLAGLQVGDRLISVNRESVAGLTYAQVVQLIQNTKGMLRLVVVPEKDDILQVYFSEIAQDPKTNTRSDSVVTTSSTLPLPGGGPGAHLGSGSSRDSSPFSSKASSDRFGGTLNSGHHPAAGRFDQEPLYESVGNPSYGGSTEHVYATPAMAGGSSVSTLGSLGGLAKQGSNVLSSKDSLNSESSLNRVQTPSHQDDQMIDKIKKDCEKKKEFLEKAVYPPYLSAGGPAVNLAATTTTTTASSTAGTPSLSSPPKELDSNPYGIASLANTMPPPRQQKKEEPAAPAAVATKNFFMDIYAKEVSKMQSASKSSAPAKKRNFDATQFNTYGRPLGYRSGGHFYETDSFSRNNFVIIGTRSLHCEPPNTYERPPDPPPPVCEGCYECQQPVYTFPAAVPVVPGPYCPVCVPVPAGCLHCASMTMSHTASPYHHNHQHVPPPPPGVHQHLHHHHQPSPPPPARPSTLPGLLTHDGGPRDSPPATRPVPSQTTPVHMHPDPSTVYSSRFEPCQTNTITSSLYDEPEVVYRRKASIKRDSDAERNLRRVSYLQATKDDRMDTEENETGIAPTHSIKKLKSIFSEKGGEPGAAPPATTPLSVKMGDGSGEVSPSSAASPKRKPSFEKAGSVTSMLTEGGGLKEGYLHCKVAVLDGKKANDRSWKSVYAVLKSKALYMYKDKKTAQENLEEFEEKPVKLAESEVEVANDYTKRKNVFRVKTEQGSEYLFQAENELMMKDWVKTIDEAAMAVIIDERKDNKLKKLASFRNRSPTGQSPASKPRKPSGESLQPLVNKDKKNWKGKMVKQLKRMGGGGGQGGPPGYPEGGSIGVPLEECPLASEYTDCDLIIPYLVKLCCDIVTERGLEIVGIYRVPGNNAAVNYLTEQINKGVPYFQLDDTRWQDVNVVSSLLKMFFRKLPDPLFTMEMYSTFIEASKIEQPAKRLEALRRLVRDLPEIHQETLKYLIKHLCNIADNSNTNKMEVRNLAIVFGPTLVRTTDDNMVTMVTDMSQQCRIIESLLSNWEYFFADTEVELEVRDCDAHEAGVQVTGSSNHQSVMLANLHKLEDAGKLSSPKGDVSAKDIVSSIISAANRKIKKTGKKDASATDLDELANQSRNDELSDSRRDSESVIHGALQIATAVPGLLGPFSTHSATSSSRGCSTPPTPSEDAKTYSSRRGSRDSYSGDGLKRRGSLPVAQNKRGSISSYSAVVTSTSKSGRDSLTVAANSHEAAAHHRGVDQHGDQVMEEPPVIVQSGTEAIRNGGEGNQQVIRGTLSLVNMNTTSTSSSSRHEESSRLSTGSTQPQYKYPFETYTGLQEAQTQRIKQFEAETKAMIHRSVEQSSSRTSIDEQINNDRNSPVLGSSTPSSNNHYHQKRSYSTGHLLTSITTPVPDTDPLTGGILLEEHYHTDVYDRVGSVETTYLPQYRDTAISSMLNMDQAHHLPAEILRAFDTNKVAARGTLQRLKVRRLDSLEGQSSNGSGVETVFEAEDFEDLPESEKDALGMLSASFDKKLKFLLDPGSVSDSSSLQCADYPRDDTSTNSEANNSETSSQYQQQNCEDNENEDSDPVEEGNQVLGEDFMEQLVKSGGTKKDLDDVKNSLLRNKKVKRTGRVDKSQEPELRRTPKPGTSGASSNNATPTSRSQLVLRQINNRKPLKRSDSLTKKEKTELNLKTKEVEKENKVTKLKEQFEAKSLMHAQAAAAITTLITQPVIACNAKKLDVNKIRKKLSDSRNNRIKRRHTVGGTKDFPDKLMNRVNQERSDQCWDRLVPSLSVQEVKANQGEEEDESSSLYHARMEESDERRLSLPDYGRLVVDQDQHIESHV